MPVQRRMDNFFFLWLKEQEQSSWYFRRSSSAGLLGSPPPPYHSSTRHMCSSSHSCSDRHSVIITHLCASNDGSHNFQCFLTVQSSQDKKKLRTPTPKIDRWEKERADFPFFYPFTNQHFVFLLYVQVVFSLDISCLHPVSLLKLYGTCHPNVLLFLPQCPFSSLP